jgi:hypothetical protein
LTENDSTEKLNGQKRLVDCHQRYKEDEAWK